jgi:fatty acid-binding protein DegV
MVERGAEAILSVHIAGTISGTLRAARLAAHKAAVPVRLVDTGTASFGVTCCAWAAALAAENGATLDEAATIAETLAGSLGNVFVVAAPELARAGGQARVPVEEFPAGELPVLSLENGEVKVVDTVTELEQAVDVMVRYIESRGTDLLAAVGLADPHGAPVSEGVVAALASSSHVREVIRYRIGPSVGAHVGPGTAGAWVFPAPSTVVPQAPPAADES